MSPNLQPTLTLSGVDERVSLRELEKLLAYPFVELGLLCTITPEGRPRYPGMHWLSWAAEHAVGRCAIHICGGGARKALLAGELDDLVKSAARIQINGQLDLDAVEQACARYPAHTIITQHHPGNASLLDVTARNHALLVDGSGGRGQLPVTWERPLTRKAVGFAGGLGPGNLRLHLPQIAAVAEGSWWVDMEQSLRLDDWFSPREAMGAVLAVERFRTGQTGQYRIA